MTLITEDYRRIVDGFDARIDAVDDGAWGRPAPCEGWTARDVVAHVTHRQRVAALRVEGFDGDDIDRQLEGVDVLAEGPVASWRAARDAFLGALDADGALDRTVVLPFGPMLVRDALAVTASDLLVHTWDLARATGGDEALPEDLMAADLDRVEAVSDMLRGPGLLGPRIECDDGAAVQTRFLCFYGRQP